MSNSLLESFKDMLKHVLCDCLCTNVDVDISSGAYNNHVSINVNPTKSNDNNSDSNADVGDAADERIEIVTSKNVDLE